MISSKIGLSQKLFWQNVTFHVSYLTRECPSLFHSADAVLTWSDSMVQLGINTRSSQSNSSLGEIGSVSSVAQLCLTLCDPLDCSTSDFPVHHQLLESAQTHVHRVGDATQPSHPLLSPFPPAFNLSQNQGLSNESVLCIRWVLEFQLQHQFLEWIFRTDFL